MTAASLTVALFSQSVGRRKHTNTPYDPSLTLSFNVPSHSTFYQACYVISLKYDGIFFTYIIFNGYFFVLLVMYFQGDVLCRWKFSLFFVAFVSPQPPFFYFVWGLLVLGPRHCRINCVLYENVSVSLSFLFRLKAQLLKLQKFSSETAQKEEECRK